MAEIIQLPTASKSPVIQERIRGRLPGSVVKLQKVRQQRSSICYWKERARIDMEQTESIAATWLDIAAVKRAELQRLLGIKTPREAREWCAKLGR